MARDFSKIKAGPCSITFNGVDLGHSQGGVGVSFYTKWRDRLVDEYGETVVDKVFQGESLELTVKLTQSQFATLKAIMPMYSYSAGSYLSFGRTVDGSKLSDDAAELVIHPFDTSGTTHDLTVFKAAVGGPVGWEYNNDSDRVYDIVFMALPDSTRGDGDRLFKLGSAN